MSGLIKDGRIYRTLEEQVVHLTEEHNKQLNINTNLNKQLLDLIVAQNEGGYNYVRFAFEKQGTFYKISSNKILNILENCEEGDFFEISSNIAEDIPAYGYLDNENYVNISFSGDFKSQYEYLTIRNITKNIVSLITVEYSQFDGTSLLDYNPQEYKRQLFNVISDLAYNSRTQYVSFDLNADDKYNFVFIGAYNTGLNGRSIYVTDGSNVDEIIQQMSLYDYILCAGTVLYNENIPDFKIGDIYVLTSTTPIKNFSFIGNIRGLVGEIGEKGEKGEQGIQGVQGAQGTQGEKGIQGNPGLNGMSLRIHTGILDNTSQLPNFSSVSVGDAYRVINTTTQIVTYDLYFKAVDGITWDIQPNWGGVPGEKGEQGNTGLQGIQGVQGIQGEKGEPGIPYNLYEHNVYVINKGNSIRVFYKKYSLSSERIDTFEKLMESIVGTNFVNTCTGYYPKRINGQQTGVFVTGIQKRDGRINAIMADNTQEDIGVNGFSYISDAVIPIKNTI